MVFKSARKTMVSVAAGLSLALAGAGLVAGAGSANAAEKLALPLKAKTYETSSMYGPRCIPVANASTWHLGDDLEAKKDSIIYAVDDGTVVKTRNGTNSVSGVIEIRHTIDGKSYVSRSLHVWTATKYVKVGQKVKKGQKIGLVGSSGPADSNHLHFELYKGSSVASGTAVNPSALMKKHGVDFKKSAKKDWGIKTPSTCTYWTTSSVNVRSSASGSAKIIKTVPKNTKMTHKPGKMTNSYIPVKIAGKSGWVHSGYITRHEPVTVTNIKDKRMVSTSKKSIKSSYSSSSTTKKNYAVGTEFVITHKTSNGWYKVKQGSTVGYTTTKGLINKPTVKNVADVKVTTTKSKSVLTKYVSGSKVKATVKKGKTLVVTHEVSNGWLKVKYGKTTGYTTNYGMKVAAKVTNVKDVKKVATANKSILSHPNKAVANAKAKAKVKKGQTVTVTHKVSNGWVKVKRGSVTGYTQPNTLRSV